MKRIKNTTYEPVVHLETICDVCGEVLREYRIEELGSRYLDSMKNPILLRLDIDYDFCSLECLKKFIDEELEKENV